jgi:hypothetical protein
MPTSDIQETKRVERQRHFIRAMSKSLEGRFVTEGERKLLDSVFDALLRGEDVSGLIGMKPPHARRSSDPVYISLHYLCLTKLMHKTPEEAWRIVGDAWGMKLRQVRWVIADNHAAASEQLRRFGADPEGLLRVCERHANGKNGAGVTVSTTAGKSAGEKGARVAFRRRASDG